MNFRKQDSLLSERIRHVSKHLVLTYDHKPDEQTLIKWFDNMVSIQSKMAAWPEYSAKLALRESPWVRSKTDPNIVKSFIDSYEGIAKLWEEMSNQFLIDSAYIVPHADGTLASKKVPLDTRNKENNEYIEAARVKYNRLHAAYEAFTKLELLQSDQLSQKIALGCF